MIKPDHRAAEPERALEAAGLPDDERDMIGRQD
jgi:hypothetical protein